jgi:hypothetical protein
MRQSRSGQIELGFNVGGNDGYAAWVRQQNEAISAKARQLGLPLGYQVELWLNDGTLLKGRLFVREVGNAVEFMIGRVGFAVNEIESCLRVD